MNFRNKLFPSYLLLIAVFIYSCANRVAPTGGKKDEVPPVLVKYTPANFSTNLKAKKILIEFDEYIQLKDLNGQLVISPLMDPEPKILFNKKILEIQLPDSLKPNTTYTLNFGNSVADLNEGNSITDFQYVFSTGDVLDSLVYKGKVIDAYSHKTDKGITVMLYKEQDDSLPFKKLPDYFAKTDEQGNFIIKNISSGTYKIFALNDKNNNYKCDNIIEESIAFLNEPIQVPDSLDKSFSLFFQKPAKVFVKKAAKENNGPVVISFNQAVEELSWKFIENEKLLVDKLFTISSEKDSLLIWVNDSTIDSLKIAFFNNMIALDTVAIKITTKKSFSRDRGEIKENKLSFTYNALSGTLIPGDTLTMLFQNPILKSETTQISITQDSISYKNYKIVFSDSIHRKLMITGDWKENITYKVLIAPGALVDVYNNVSDSIQFSFIQLPVSDFGSLITSVTGITGTGNYQLQLVNESLQIIKTTNISKPAKCTFENITPGTYKLRLLVDMNKNNKWDSGDYWKKIQPEDFFYYSDPIQIRANWELEVNLDCKF